MNIRKSIKVACATKGITQRELSSKSGIGESTISIIMNKNKSNTDTLIDISYALNMSLSSFIALGE